MNIETSYAILIGVVIILTILTVTRKMSLGIGLIGIGTGFGIAFLLAPYTEIVMSPVGNAIIYGGAWTINVILGVAHLATMIIIVIIAAYNLMASGGKIIWA